MTDKEVEIQQNLEELQLTLECKELCEEDTHILHQEINRLVAWTRSRINFVEPSSAIYWEISKLELSQRTCDLLRKNRMIFIGDIVLRSERDILKIQRFGTVALGELKKALQQLGFSLNTKLPPQTLKKLQNLRKERSIEL